MKTLSIKQLALSLMLGVGSIMTLPAYASSNTAHNTNHKNHADCVLTDGMNKSGPIITKSTGRSKLSVKAFTRPKHKALAKMSKVKRISAVHNPNHKNHADCVRTDRLNNKGKIVKKVAHRPVRKKHIDQNLYRQAQAVLNMSRVKHVSKIHNTNHKNHADCVRTDGLNNSGAIVKVVRRKHH